MRLDIPASRWRRAFLPSLALPALLLMGHEVRAEGGRDPVALRVTIARGQVVEIAPGVRIVFEEHSHKRMRVGTGPSPLIVYMGYEMDGIKETGIQHNVSMKEAFEPCWSRHGYRFCLEGSVYGKSMDLRIAKDSAEPMSSAADQVAPSP